MQSVEGMTRAQWAEKGAKIRGEAQAAQQQAMQLRSIQRQVLQEIESWQRDKDAAHLLRAITMLQGGMGVAAGVASASAGAAAEVSGVARSWQPDPPPMVGTSAAGSISSLLGGAQDAVDHAADFAKSTVRNGFNNIENKVQKAAKLLEGVAEAAKKGWGLTGGQGVGGFGGRVGGQAAGAPATQGGFGGRVGGSAPQPRGDGFKGRTGGTIP